ncbi:discoidin domain-containing protein [Streptomyces sp. NPDC004435]|uniref:galactose-binding domain-containing protein n=1 Tax=Streptomyces sp. NPDC004435 TaxID=3364701 RepID=UPI003693BA7D
MRPRAPQLFTRLLTATGVPRRIGTLALATALILGLSPALSASALPVPAAEPPTLALTTKPTPEGTVELNWTATPSGQAAGIRGYEVHRSTSAADFEPTDGTRLYRLPDVPHYLDSTAAPGSNPWYRISALNAEGEVLAISSGVRAELPAQPQDKQRTSVLAALDDASTGSTRLSWRATAGAATPLTVYAGPAHVADGKLDGAWKAATSTTTANALTLRSSGTATSGFALVDAKGQVLATATRGRGAHPRLLSRAELDELRQIIKTPGTPTQTWQSLLKSTATGANGARDQAFLYVVTGQQAYADRAFTYFQQAAQTLRTQQTLEFANSVSPIALAYDLAYNGWTSAQRTEAQDTMKRALAYLGTVHHANFDNDADKSSNWVAIHRGAELSALLAARGDGDVGLQEQRLAVLADELRRHFDDAFGETGWNQEGWDYVNYGLTGSAPAVRALQAAGIEAVDRAWKRPRLAELALHTQSLRPTNEKLQFGVGERTGALTPHLLSTGSPQAQSAYRWLYEHTAGHASTRVGNTVTGDLFALLNWPAGIPAKDPDAFPQLKSALLDDAEGAFYFRNRTQGDDDTLIGVTNRNRAHMGWSQPEALSLNLIGQGTTWSRMPAKENTNTALFSKPLIDQLPAPKGVTPGRGSTREARPYPGQGGGFLSLDAHQDYGIATADRELAVDLRPTAGADAVLAVHDRFTDTTSHRIDWQLAPEPGVTITYGKDEDGARTFLFQREDAWLKGWLLDADGAMMSITGGAFRITRTGASADFRIVLALGRGAPPTADADGSRITLGGVTYDTADLGSFRPASPAPHAGSTRPTLQLTTPNGPFMPGTSREVTAAYTWWAEQPALGLTLTLDVPEGWRAERISEPAPASLRTAERALTTWKVTAPERLAAGDHRLATRASTVNGDPADVTDSAAAAAIRTNLALNTPAEQSSTQGAASRATDGNINGMWGQGSVSHTLQESQPWWQTDLGASADIGHIVLWNRVDCCPERLRNFYVLVSQQPFGTASLDDLLERSDVWKQEHKAVASRTTTIAVDQPGRYVRVQLADTEPGYLALAEVQVLPPAQGHLAQGQPAEQSSTDGDAAAGRAVDGNTSGAASLTMSEKSPWWQTDLGESVGVGSVEVWSGSATPGDFYLLVSDTPFASHGLADVLAQPGVTAYRHTSTERPAKVKVARGARYIRIQIASEQAASLSLSEVRVLR